MADALQDDGLAKGLLSNQQRLETKRAPWESLWREIDERVDPLGAGGFGGSAMPGNLRGQHNFDATAPEGLDRWTAAIAGMTIPRNQRYQGLVFGDKDLDKLPSVRQWCERATDRLFAIRYAAHAGFETQAHQDIRQLGKYGSAPLWVGELPGVGLFYSAVHMSEVYFEEDFRGQVDTTHRKFTKNVRQLRQQYRFEALSPKMREAIERDKLDTEFQVLTVIRPNADRDPERFDWRSMPIESVHIAVDEKWIMRRSGFHSMPMPVSRHITGPGDGYGRSPAMKVLGTILGVNQMGRTILRAAHKATDPALAFYDDDGINSLSTKPGGLNPGMVDEMGRMLVHPMPTGSNFVVGENQLENERQVIRTAFLEEVFQILTNPGDRMTATQVLEMVAKQGVLVAPFAGRHETEKMSPVTDREIDLALRAGQIDPLPPEVLEARAWPKVSYNNPLAKMARAQEAVGLARWVESVAPLAATDGGAIYDWIDQDAAAPGLADVLNVRPSWVRTPEAVAALRQRREENEAAAAGVDQLATAAGAFKDLAQGGAAAAAA